MIITLIVLVYQMKVLLFFFLFFIICTCMYVYSVYCREVGIYISPILYSNKSHPGAVAHFPHQQQVTRNIYMIVFIKNQKAIFSLACVRTQEHHIMK